MTTTDIATRVYNHAFKLDPIIRSLLDTDVYKLLMLQTIWRELPHVPVTFSVINRSSQVRLAESIDEVELREQLDHARTVQLTKKERIWLAGNTFYGTERLFSPEFLAWLGEYRLPEYDLRVEDGQFRIDFSGPWAAVTLWEIPVLSIISELRSRVAMKGIGRFELDVLYARAKAKLWEKVVRLNALPDLRIADFGTRRRHSFLWHRWCVEAMKEGLREKFTGTSNILHAMELDIEAIGTNGHELPMVQATMCGDDRELLRIPYRVLESWQRAYEGNLLIVLPDTFGTTSFLRHAPDWVARWSGFRIDSKDPIEGGEEIVAWWKAPGQAAHLLRRAGHRRHRAGLSSLLRPGASRLRLGNPADQRHAGLRTGDESGTRSHLAGVQGDPGQWPPDGQAVGQPGEGVRPALAHRALQGRVRVWRAGAEGPRGIDPRRRSRRPFSGRTVRSRRGASGGQARRGSPSRGESPLRAE